MKYLPILSLAFLISCGGQEKPTETADNSEVTADTVATVSSDWHNNSVIYEVNLRQMTEEGTFKSFQDQHLDRLEDLGVEILWFMPIFPIGEEKRKGTMGSYYAVQDYQATNPEHGTMEEFKALVDAAHAKGMKVILDWVTNHTAWDNVWLADHPDWFTKDENGNYVPPVADWSDVMDLNYDNADMREEMIKSLEFWLKEADIDGYRCDVAEMVPLDFWVDARKRLDAIKPVFFLAEGEPAELHEAFDMTYAWSFHHLMNEVSRGEKGASDVAAYWSDHQTKYAEDDYRMQFITNHDENSWNGTAIERMGENRKGFAVLTYTVPGMPLIYSGMEADMDKRLEFFEKDVIDWKDLPLNEFYRKLNLLKTNHAALANGAAGGSLEFVDTGNEKVLAYFRSKGDKHVLTVINFSDQKVEIDINHEALNGQYFRWFIGAPAKLKGNLNGSLKANSYLLLVKL
ncbi:MAG: glycosidase [Bacteroidia bacterium]|jgi:glycosidase